MPVMKKRIVKANFKNGCRVWLSCCWLQTPGLPDGRPGGIIADQHHLAAAFRPLDVRVAASGFLHELQPLLASRKATPVRGQGEFPLQPVGAHHSSARRILLATELRIQDVFPRSRIQIFSIPDPGSSSFPSRIRIKDFKYFNPKNCF